LLIDECKPSLDKLIDASLKWGKPSLKWGKPSLKWGKPSLKWGEPSLKWGKPSLKWGKIDDLHSCKGKSHVGSPQ